MKPTIKTVNKTLAGIEAAERDPQHPRSLARQAVIQWRSDAEREQLPVTNLTDSGAPLLDRDAVLRRSNIDHIGKR